MVACGSSDIYFECGIHCWDMAAGLVLIQEAGGVLTNTKGEYIILIAWLWTSQKCSSHHKSQSEK